MASEIANPTGNVLFHDGDFMLSSPTGTCKLSYVNSNFTLAWVEGGGGVIWATSNAPNPGVTAQFQDGRLTIGSVWSDGNTGGNPGAVLKVTDDGHAKIVKGSRTLWDNGTVL
jgi:hypothetical protein